MRLTLTLFFSICNQAHLLLENHHFERGWQEAEMVLALFRVQCKFTHDH